MAVTDITPVKGVLNKITEFAFVAASSATDGMKFVMPRTGDEYVVVLVHNSGSAAYDFTVKKPTAGSYAAAGADETHNLSAGEFAMFRLETAKWANRDGTISMLPSNVAVKAAVLC